MLSAVNGHADLHDFFPLWINLGKNTKNLGLQANGMYFTLEPKGIGVAYTFLTRGTAGAFLTVEANAVEKTALSAAIVHSGCGEEERLPDEFPTALEGKYESGIAMAEGRAVGGQVILRLKKKMGFFHSDKELLKVTFKPSLSTVTKMFRTLDFTDSGFSLKKGCTNEPPNYPDAEATAKTDVFFVHGFKVDAGHAPAWNDRFKDIANHGAAVRNYYSSGDEVFEIYTKGVIHSWSGWKPSLFEPASITDFSQFSWHKQEWLKGRGVMEYSDWAGWAFNQANDTTPPYTAEQAQAIVDTGRAQTAFTALPVFKAVPDWCFTQEGYDAARVTANRDQILCFAIPAISTAMGRTKLKPEQVQVESVQLDGEHPLFRKPGVWGRPPKHFYKTRWLHCDIKDMAYFYISKVFDDFANAGEMKAKKE